jgi:hypothetical protein
MGSPISFLTSFPPGQKRELAAALKLCRRRVDQSLTSTTLSSGTATAVATLVAPAAEVGIGTVLHLQVAGTIRNNTGATTNATIGFLLEDNGLDLHNDTVPAADVPDAAGTESVPFLYEARIMYATPTSVVVSGRLLIGAFDQTEADTGTGQFETTAMLSGPFVSTSSSGQIAADHRITLTVDLGSAAGADFDMTVLAANLWAE